MTKSAQAGKELQGLPKPENSRRKTGPGRALGPRAPLRHSLLGIPSSFVIRHSSFSAAGLPRVYPSPRAAFPRPSACYSTLAYQFLRYVSSWVHVALLPMAAATAPHPLLSPSLSSPVPLHSTSNPGLEVRWRGTGEDREGLRRGWAQHHEGRGRTRLPQCVTNPFHRRSARPLLGGCVTLT